MNTTENRDNSIKHKTLLDILLELLGKQQSDAARAKALDAIEAYEEHEADSTHALRPRLDARPLTPQWHVPLIVGHTARAGGAFSSALQSYEYDYWKKVANLMLERNNVGNTTLSVHLRDNGTRRAYDEARLSVKHAGQHIPFIMELHFNASVDKFANGIETLAIATNPVTCGIASAMSHSFQQSTGNKLRHGNGVKRLFTGDRGYVNLTYAGDKPAVLVEPFFGSNTSDVSNGRWTSIKSAAQHLERAIIHGIVAVTEPVSAANFVQYVETPLRAE